MLVDSCEPISLLARSALMLTAAAVGVAIPVGLYLISPLNRPISSSSVHGSLSSCWSASSSASSVGVGVLACSGGVGDAACAVLVRFRGGISAAQYTLTQRFGQCCITWEHWQRMLMLNKVNSCNSRRGRCEAEPSRSTASFESDFAFASLNATQEFYIYVRCLACKS